MACLDSSHLTAAQGSNQDHTAAQGSNQDHTAVNPPMGPRLKVGLRLSVASYLL